ncbi:hypothetical protein MMC21_001127 [Puttea exsequens]|nr:hypothetical protein [Puttea exsequens]
MASKKIWATTWDREEMSAAATAADIECLQNTGPIISGFTPINQPSDRCTDKEDGIARTDRQKPLKMRERQPTVSKPDLKVRKTMRPKRTKQDKSVEKPNSQDVSKGLPRTKPKASRRKDQLPQGAVPQVVGVAKHVGALSSALNERTARDSDPRNAVNKAKRRSNSLSANFQAGCPNLSKNSKVAESLSDRESRVLFATSSDVLVIDEAEAEKIRARAIVKSHPQRTSWAGGPETITDLEAPTSAQASKHVGAAESISRAKAAQVPVSPFPPTVEYFNSDEFFSDEQELEDVAMDDSDFEGVIQSIETKKADHGHVSSQTTYDSDDQFWQDLRVPDEEPVESPNRFSRSDVVAMLDQVFSAQTVKDSAARATPSSDDRAKPALSVPSSQSSCVLTRVSGNAVKTRRDGAAESIGTENAFDDDDLDEDLAALAETNSDSLTLPTPIISPLKPTSPKLQWMPSKRYTPTKSTQVPASLTDVPHMVPVNDQGDALPFLRPAFPKPIRDRSPILGLTNRTVLRTCFRIGEALNAAAVASRANINAIFELYARICFSEREQKGGRKQFFLFADLFTDKPPYLRGTYSLWKDSGLWNEDSKVFLGNSGRGKMARALGRVKRCEGGGGCEMVVLSIWEVDWEDVGMAKGAVCL